jgi:hypothetical protein
MISKEIEASNSDKKFGETIGLYQDSVVMGSYFDYESFNAGETVKPTAGLLHRRALQPHLRKKVLGKRSYISNRD